jgi:hypothetical protein
MKLGYLALGNQGTVIPLTNPKRSPREQLLGNLGAKSCRNTFCDTKNGTPAHIGYIVGDEWFNIYEVHNWKGPANP